MNHQIIWRSADTRPVGGAQLHFKIVATISYMEERFTDSGLRLSDVARHARLSPTHLARVLKSATGLTFLQHLRRLRVRRAEHRLATTMLSLKEIAGECGYAASGSFTRDFRRMHGCTPTTWRNRGGSPQELLAHGRDCEAIARTAS